MISDKYCVPKLKENQVIEVTVPGSKSITNRALMLAALSADTCTLKGVLFSEDSRAFLDCLEKLGFELEIREELREVTVVGTAGKIPDTHGKIHVKSAGTAARFLTVLLAFSGGEYEIDASEQMKKRPMEPIIRLLRELGAQIDCIQEEGHFPLKISSEGLDPVKVSIDTTLSSQFASALLMAAPITRSGLIVTLLGNRSEGAYIKLTLSMLTQFGIVFEKTENIIKIPGKQQIRNTGYEIEPDISGACYFYAMAPLLKSSVKVQGVHWSSMQGDISFLKVLQDMGCTAYEEADGIRLDGTGIEGSYPGMKINMNNFSDQTMTMAALAPFAGSETYIYGVEHIRSQESDRIHAIKTELNRLGIICEEVEKDGIRILPGQVQPCTVNTYDDHRMAMAFTLIGLKKGNLIIDNPGCCKKTFENYFEIIGDLSSGQ